MELFLPGHLGWKIFYRCYIEPILQRKEFLHLWIKIHIMLYYIAYVCESVYIVNSPAYSSSNGQFTGPLVSNMLTSRSATFLPCYLAFFGLNFEQ